MLEYLNNRAVGSKREELDTLKIEALENRLNRSKASIIKLKTALSTIRNNDKLKKRFEDRIVEESEIALEVLTQLKVFRKQISERRAS